jgi:hypothetical protein
VIMPIHYQYTTENDRMPAFPKAPGDQALVHERCRI